MATFGIWSFSVNYTLISINLSHSSMLLFHSLSEVSLNRKELLGAHFVGVCVKQHVWRHQGRSISKDKDNLWFPPKAVCDNQFTVYIIEAETLNSCFGFLVWFGEGGEKLESFFRLGTNRFLAACQHAERLKSIANWVECLHWKKLNKVSSDNLPLCWCSHFSHIVWIQVAGWAFWCRAAKEVLRNSHATRSADSLVCSSMSG